MSKDEVILSIDQGTTSSRAILFKQSGQSLFSAQEEFTQIFPHDGWVEHDPEEIWRVTLKVCQTVAEYAQENSLNIAGIGITNQRETTIIWNKLTGKPIYNAIVWQDRRTSDVCENLRKEGLEETFQSKTGLLLDPYFSGTKIQWLLDHVEGARAQAEKGELLFGTIDTFLLWRLTEGKEHATDATNASRTLLFNIYQQHWDDTLLSHLNIPKIILPTVKNCADNFGITRLLGGEIPILGIAGDQHAATIGQACFDAGMVKSTYGTGCFVMLNTGKDVLTSSNKLLSTTLYRINGEATYALEGTVFIAGAAIQWLRDGLNIINHAKETEALASSIENNKGVYLVPAFTGLGAPYWDPEARGGMFGLTRDTGIAEIVRATLEAVCYQTHDLMTAMKEDGQRIKTLRVDGGMVRNNWAMQFLADILNLEVQRPVVTETTALGAAMLAALQLGWFDTLEDIANNWQLDKTFHMSMDLDLRKTNLLGWKKAVERVR